MTLHLEESGLIGAPVVIPRGAANFPYVGIPSTREFVFLALPHFTLLAFSSAIEPLRIANQLTQQPLYRWTLLSMDGEPVESSAGIRVQVDGGLATLDRNTTVVVCSGNDAVQAADKPVLAWLRKHARHGGTVGAICTGAYTLARAGLLGSDSPAVHWENQPAFREMFNITPLPHIYEIGLRRFSCAGGEAGVDLMLAMIAQDHGQKLADAIAEMCLHARRREGRVAQREIYPAGMVTRNPAVARVIAAMKENIATPLDQDDLAQIFGRTVRQLERCFKAVTQQTPKQYYMGVRLEEARNLLADTEMTILEIACATGFNSRSSFAKAFKARFNVSIGQFK